MIILSFKPGDPTADLEKAAVWRAITGKLREIYGNNFEPHPDGDHELFKETLQRNDVRAIYYALHGSGGEIQDANGQWLSAASLAADMKANGWSVGKNLQAVVIGACEAGKGDWEKVLGVPFHGPETTTDTGETRGMLEKWLPELTGEEVP